MRKTTKWHGSDLFKLASATVDIHSPTKAFMFDPCHIPVPLTRRGFDQTAADTQLDLSTCWLLMHLCEYERPTSFIDYLLSYGYLLCWQIYGSGSGY